MISRTHRTLFLLGAAVIVASTIAYVLVGICRRSASREHEAHLRRLEFAELDNQIQHVRRGLSRKIVFTPYTGPGTDEQVERISRLKALDAVIFDRVDLTDDGLHKVSTLPHLKSLVIIGCQVTDSGIASFRDNGTIENLVLAHTNVTEASIEVIATFQRLQRLVLCQDRNAITTRHWTVDELRGLTRLSSLRVLRISGGWTTELNEHALEELRKWMDGVEIAVDDDCGAHDAVIHL